MRAGAKELCDEQMFEFGASHKQNWISISGSDEPTSWFLRCPNPDLDLPGTKSVSGRLTLIGRHRVLH